MAAVSKFPLLQLPQKEILQTIKSMDIDHKMSFSLISKRCKQIVRSLQIKAKCIYVSINSRIEISVALPNESLKLSFKDSDADQKRSLRAPLYVSVFFFHRLERIGFEYSDWLEHFQTIFHYPSIANIGFYRGSCEYDLDKIREIFGATKTLYAGHTGCYSYNRMLFQKFFPIEKMNIHPDMFQNSRIPFNILQQNYATLEIECDDDTTEMTLNELLAINSKRITIENVRISPQDLNVFIKLWMKGSNSRMEYLYLFRTNDSQYDIAMIMKGIKHSEIENGKEFEVYRMDGTCATILFGVRSVQMLVWFD